MCKGAIFENERTNLKKKHSSSCRVNMLPYTLK